MQCIGSICKVLKTEDWKVGKHIPMLLSLTTLYQADCLEKVVHTKTDEIRSLKKFTCRRVCHQKFPSSVPGKFETKDKFNTRVVQVNLSRTR